MKPCRDLEKYLTENLCGKMLLDFERHLGECSSCRAEVEQWKNIDRRVTEWSSSFDLPNPTAVEAAELVVGLEPKGSKRAWSRPVFVMGAAAATAAVAFALYLVGGDGHFEQEVSKPIAQFELVDSDILHPVRVVYSERSEFPTAEPGFARRLLVPGDGRLVLELGKDRMGLAAKSEIQILASNDKETRIRLRKGEVAVNAASRKQGGMLFVEAGACTVKVIGTRFKVSMTEPSDVAVSVDEGEVMVDGPGQASHRVKAGQVLELVDGSEWNYVPLDNGERKYIAAMLTAPVEQTEDAVVAVQEAAIEESIETASVLKKHNQAGTTGSSEGPVIGPADWRKWILDGEYKQAENSLLEHIERNPSDATALSLLANCRRKSGNFKGAVATYERIISKSGAGAASAARFDAAVLLQDRLGKHARAAGLLNDYLKKSPLLEAEATLRLAKAWIKMGRTSEGRNLLVQVKERHRSTSAAIEAEKLLAQMNSTDPQ